MVNIDNFNIDKYVIKTKDVTDKCRNRHKALMIKYKNDLEITDEHWISFIQKEQRDTLIKWIEYLKKLDCSYNIKNWILNSIVKMSYLDKKTGTFRKRNKNTIHPFPEINEIAVLMSIEQRNLQNNISFRKLYERNLNQLLSIKSNNGTWVSYNFNEVDSLISDINGWYTGWCITNRDVALVNLLAGDIHIFYSQIEDDYSYPRIAIGMQGKKIRICVGILDNQFIESKLRDILSDKLLKISTDTKILENKNIVKLIK